MGGGCDYERTDADRAMDHYNNHRCRTLKDFPLEELKYELERREAAARVKAEETLRMTKLIESQMPRLAQVDSLNAEATKIAMELKAERETLAATFTKGE